MHKWFGRLRALVPASLAARAAVLIVLTVTAVGGPAYAAHRLLTRQAQARRCYEAEAFVAAALAEYLQRAPIAVAGQPEWLKAADGLSDRVRWAGLFGWDGQGFEFRRRTALPREQILAQIDFAATSAQSKPLVVDGAPSDRLELLTFPQSDAGVTLAIVLDRQDGPAATAASRLLGLAGLGLAGLLAAVGWFHFAVQRPIRRVSRTLANVQEGLTRATLDGLPPSELTQLVESVEATRQEMRKWRVEAAYLRHSVEVEVDARTRKAARAARRAEQAADTDALTQLGNRRALERELPRLFAAHQQTRAELSLVMIDLDGFKRLNDLLGHTTGDALLSFLGSLVRSITRRGVDLGIRYGGDEFVLLLPGTTAAQACDVVHRLGKLFAQRARTIEGVDPPPGLSAGVAAVREHSASSWQELLRMADEAMYWAKRQRRGVATVREARVADGAIR